MGVKPLVVRSVGGVATSLAEERTFSWANGIPNDALLAASDATRESLFGLMPSGARPRMEKSAIGMSVRYQPGGGVVASSSLPKLERYQAGHVRRIDFTLEAASGLAYHRSLESDAVDPSARILGFEELPSDLRQMIESQDDQLRQAIEISGRRSPAAKP